MLLFFLSICQNFVSSLNFSLQFCLLPKVFSIFIALHIQLKSHKYNTQNISSQCTELSYKMRQWHLFSLFLNGINQMHDKKSLYSYDVFTVLRKTYWISRVGQKATWARQFYLLRIFMSYPSNRILLLVDKYKKDIIKEKQMVEHI